MNAWRRLLSIATWLLTWTSYGIWLPGDSRCSVTRVRDVRPATGRAEGVSPPSLKVENNHPSENVSPPSQSFEHSVRSPSGESSSKSIERSNDQSINRSNFELGGLTPTARQSCQSSRHEHDIPGTPYESGIRGLELAARGGAQVSPIRLTFERSLVLFAQFQETAQYRGWKIFAVAIMTSHVSSTSRWPVSSSSRRRRIFQLPRPPRPRILLSSAALRRKRARKQKRIEIFKIVRW